MVKGKGISRVVEFITKKGVVDHFLDTQCLMSFAAVS